MNTRRNISILSILLWLAGCSPTGDKVILEKQWLATQLGLSHLVKVARPDSLTSSLVVVLDSLYSAVIVDTFFVDSLHHTRAFEFQITSSSVGIATIHYDGDEPTGIDFFNLFDLSLEHYLRPSFSVLLFNDGKSGYVFDGFRVELYQRDRNGRMTNIARGLLKD